MAMMLPDFGMCPKPPLSAPPPVQSWLPCSRFGCMLACLKHQKRPVARTALPAVPGLVERFSAYLLPGLLMTPFDGALVSLIDEV
eukprot:353452-Chlamydomonas_euryale.AAC.2